MSFPSLRWEGGVSKNNTIKNGEKGGSLAALECAGILRFLEIGKFGQ